MNGREYLKTQMAMIEIGKQIQSLDFDGLIGCFDNAQKKGMELNPELYSRAKSNIEAMRELATSFKQVKTDYARVQEHITKTTVAYLIEDETKDEDVPPAIDGL